MTGTNRQVSFWPGHPISYTTTRIELYFDNQELATGTGFVMIFAREYVLVTNWHVLSGRSPIDGTCLSATGGIPNRILFHVALVSKDKIADKVSETIYFKPLDISLYGPDDEPIWHDARTEHSMSDYAVIVLRDVVPELADETYSLRAIDGGIITLKRGVEPAERMRMEDINHAYPQVGSQVFVVGYPAGFNSNGVFPIWKGGTIASEPAAGLSLGSMETDDVFLVDGLTRAGMSGAPVIRMQNVDEQLFTDDGVQITVKEAKPLLVGVYAGREGVTANEADWALGRVWKIGAVERLIAQAIPHSRR